MGINSSKWDKWRQPEPGGGFEYFLCSSRKLGKWSNLKIICFEWVSSTTNYRECVFPMLPLVGDSVSSHSNFYKPQPHQAWWCFVHSFFPLLKPYDLRFPSNLSVILIPKIFGTNQCWIPYFRVTFWKTFPLGLLMIVIKQNMMRSCFRSCQPLKPLPSKSQCFFCKIPYDYYLIWK